MNKFVNKQHHEAVHADSDDPVRREADSESAFLYQSLDLASSPVVELFVHYGFIALLGVVAQIFMVIAEGFVVGRGLGEYGLACMSVVMTFEIINISFGSSLGQGVSTICGNRLGRCDEEAARAAFGQGFWMTLFFSAALGFGCFVGAPYLVDLMGATAEIRLDCIRAVRIFVSCYPFCITGQMLCQMLRQDQHPAMASAIQTIGSVVAAVWLVLSIFILDLGVGAAAGYYAISTATWFIAVIPFVVRSKNPDRVFIIELKDIRITGEVAQYIIHSSLPVFLVQLSSALFIVVMNRTLGTYGNTQLLAAFSVINSYFMYTLNILCMALVSALQPIAAYNKGAQNNRRLADLMMSSLIFELVGLAVAALIANLLVEVACHFFCGGDIELARVSAEHARTFLLFCSMGFSGQIMSAYFESIGRTKAAIFFGIVRYVVFAIPAIIMLNACFGVDAVWYAIPLADILTFVLTCTFVAREYRLLTGVTSIWNAVRSIALNSFNCVVIQLASVLHMLNSDTIMLENIDGSVA